MKNEYKGEAMKKRIITGLGVVMVVLMLAAAGCSAAKTQAVQPVNVSVNSQEGIWVSGTGKVPVAPDLAVLNLGVEVNMTSVVDAQSRAAQAMDKVMQVLTSKGIIKADIQTQNYNIYQNSRWDGIKQENIYTGYKVSNMLSVKIRDLGSISNVIDEVVTAGGDVIRFQGINFSVEKPEQYYVQAREHAMQDARANAEKLASLAGAKLDKMTYVVENTGNQTYYSGGANSNVRAPIALNAVDTPISIGQNDVVVTVTVAYSIQ
jgi:uncharacterized protein YggE